MIKGIFLDFYGTVVHEDGDVIRKITDIIIKTGECADPSQIGSFWWNEFQTLFLNASGDAFETQRRLEYKSLVRTLKKFHSSADADELSGMMFEHWIKPPIFEDAKAFFNVCPLPVYIVSNIDTDDIRQAVAFHGLKPAGVYTSEDARAYKPKKELFELALRSSGLSAKDVIHIGDSISSDVKGAGAAGIRALWLNRSGRETPEGVTSVSSLTDVPGKYF